MLLCILREGEKERKGGERERKGYVTQYVLIQKVRLVVFGMKTHAPAAVFPAVVGSESPQTHKEKERGRESPSPSALTHTHMCNIILQLYSARK